MLASLKLRIFNNLSDRERDRDNRGRFTNYATNDAGFNKAPERPRNIRRRCPFCKRRKPFGGDLKRHMEQRCRESRGKTTEELRIARLAATPYASDNESLQNNAAVSEDEQTENLSNVFLSPSTENNISKSISRLESAVNLLRSNQSIFPALPNESSESTAEAAYQKLQNTFSIAKVKTMDDALSFDRWYRFFRETSDIRKSLQSKEVVGAGSMSQRAESVRRFFNICLSHDLLSEDEEAVVTRILNKLVNPFLDKVQPARVKDMAATLHKRRDEIISMELVGNYARFLSNEREQEGARACYGLRLAEIYVHLNADNAVRPSGIENITMENWNARRILSGKAGWTQVYCPLMKGGLSLTKDAYVSLSPLIEMLTKSYISDYRPQAATEKANEFVFLTEKGQRVTNANAFSNLRWSKFKKIQKVKGAPARFRFQMMRTAVQTTTRHAPVEGQPPQKVINAGLGHGEGPAAKYYEALLSRERQAGLADWIHARHQAQQTAYQPVAIEHTE